MTERDRDQLPPEELVPADDAIIGVAFKWSLVVLAMIAVIVGGVLFLRRDRAVVEEIVDERPPDIPGELVDAGADRPTVVFTDVTDAAGIDFVHEDGARGAKYLPETMGGGGAFLDHDGDGDQDLLLVNGRQWPDDPAPDPPPTMRLYRNDGTGRFEDVTVAAGLDLTLYGMGVACGDYDGDGDVDVFLTALGPDVLLRNDGGRFTDVTAAAGVAGPEDAWSSSAGFFDADADGDLDLFVCRYVEWSRELDMQIGYSLNGVDRSYGPPTDYPGTFSTLWRNEGDGTFTDVSAESGIHVVNDATGRPSGKALAVTFLDVGGDGALDVFVANDTTDNWLLRNDGAGTFTEVGLASGVAVAGDTGSATGAMGVDAGECENDGRLGIGVGNFSGEASSLFMQQPRDAWQWADVSGGEGVGSPSRLKLSFGFFLFDYDLDGRLDILQANGHLEPEINEVQPSQHYRQPTQLFWNTGGPTCFGVVPEDETGDLGRPIVGRGAAYADVDADGDLDVLLVQAGDRALLMRNDQQTGHHWLRVVLRGAAPNTDAIGARLELDVDGTTQRRWVMPTRSYLSQVERPVTFGLGPHDEVDALRIRWPDGTEQAVDVPGVDRVLVVEQP